jgi:hypothetical protein
MKTQNLSSSAPWPLLKTLTLSMAMALLVACGGPKGEITASPTPTTTPRPFGHAENSVEGGDVGRVTTASFGLSDLIKSCRSAGASFGLDLQCTCQNHQVFRISKTGEGQCKDVPNNLYASLGLLVDKRDAAGLERLIQEKNTLSDFWTAMYSLRAPLDVAAQWDSLRQIVDHSETGFYPNFPVLSGTNDVQIVPRISTDLDDANPNLIDSLFSIPTFEGVNTLVVSYPTVYFEKDLSQLISAFDFRSSAVAIQKVPAPLREVSTIAPALNEAVLFLRDFIPDTAKIRTVGSCLRLCTFTLEWSSVDPKYADLSSYLASPGHVLKWQRSFLFGKVFRDLLWLQNREGMRQGLVTLTTNGSVANYVLHTEEIVENSLYFVSDIYTRDWTLFASVKQTQELNPFFERLNKVPVADPADHSVLICDDPMSLASLNKPLADHLVRGSAANDQQRQGSLMGWFQSDGHSSRLFLDGIFQLGYGIIATPSGHGEQVAETLVREFKKLSAKSVRFSMATPEICLSRFENISGQLRQADVRVVNMSFALLRNPEECRAGGWDRLFLEKNLLAIAGGGNLGQRNPEYRCPQNLGPLENLIVVGGEPFGSTDYGSGLVDILAPEGERGSSISAPHVTALAQAIVMEYPTLTAKEIRRAILISANIPLDGNKRLQPIDVRSGGTLNPQQALKIAATISQAPSETVAEVLAKFYGNNQAEQRLKLYEINKLLNSL